MKNAVLIIESYPDEKAEGVLADYDNLPAKFKTLIDKGLTLNRSLGVDAYESGLQANYNSIIKINKGEEVKFIGTVTILHRY